MRATGGRQTAGGFTLVELIIGMLVVAIISIAAIPRLFNTQAFKARGFYDATLSLVRYAQKVAVAQRQFVYVNVVSSANLICLSYASPDPTCSNPAAVVTDPLSLTTRYQLSAPGGVSFGSGFSTFGFNGLGQPIPNVAQTIQILGDGMTRTMTIELETGYVH